MLEEEFTVLHVQFCTPLLTKHFLFSCFIHLSSSLLGVLVASLIQVSGTLVYVSLILTVQFDVQQKHFFLLSLQFTAFCTGANSIFMEIALCMCPTTKETFLFNLFCRSLKYHLPLRKKLTAFVHQIYIVFVVRSSRLSHSHSVHPFQSVQVIPVIIYAFVRMLMYCLCDPL